MAYASKEWTGTTSETYLIDYEYLEEEHIQFWKNDVLQNNSERTFDSEFVLRITAPLTTDTIRFTRSSSIETPLVDWESGAGVSAANLDTNTLQMLYVAQEAADTGEIDISIAENAAVAALAAQVAAETAQTAAELAETGAETAETNAETAETGAETAETNAETAQTAAEAAQAAAELAASNIDDDITDILTMGVRKSVRQTYLSGPDLEATSSTIETSATKTGNLQDTYHDLSMDMQTGSRGGMALFKKKAAGNNNFIHSSLFETEISIVTDLTSALQASTRVKQFTASGLQCPVSTPLNSTNLYAFQTTHKTVLDSNEWHYNPVSGFAMCKYTGTSTARQLKHPMGKVPIWFAVKNLEDGANGWFTGRAGSGDYMQLHTTAAEGTSATIWQSLEATDTYINIGTNDSVNMTGEELFLFGWFGDPLDDLEVGMVGERGVTASWVYEGGSGAMSVDTGITDIQNIIMKKTDATSDWFIENKAAGWNKFTRLNTTEAEGTSTIADVSGSTVTYSGSSSNYLFVVVGSTADAPDNKLKAGTKVLRKVGTGATGHRVDLGAAYSGGDNGGMMFGRTVGSVVSNLITDTIQGAGQSLFTNTDAAQAAAATGVEAFTSTGVTLGSLASLNPATLCQYTGFNTTHKITTGDGLDWEYNPLTGFAMCEYIGNGTAGRTLTHPMGKKLRMGWVKQKSEVRDWIVYINSLGATDYMKLNETDATAASITIFNDTEPNSTTVTLGDSSLVNKDTKPYMFYGWFGDDLSDIDTGVTGERGVSAFWQYEASSGAMSVDTGIDNITALLFKVSSTTGNWVYMNVATDTYYPLNDTTAETSPSGFTIEGSVVSWSGSAATVEWVAFGSKADSGVDNDVILPATGDTAIFSMANGFNEWGNVDVITELTANQTLNITGTAGKKFIYLEDDGLMYFDSVRPTYERDFVPYANGKRTYDITTAKMYNNGVLDTAVCIGECMLDNDGNVYDIKTYAQGDVCESDWFTGIASTTFYEDNCFGHLELLGHLIGQSASGKEFISVELLKSNLLEHQIAFDSSLDAVNYKIVTRRNF